MIEGDDGLVDVEYPEHEGVAVWIRPDLIRATHARAMRDAHDIRTISEVDDNYLSNPRLNIFLRVNRFGAEQQLDHLKAMTAQDAIVFSTEWLRDFYWRKMRQAFGRSLLPEPFVCRNNIPEEDWPEPIPREGPLRVGWMGSPSHVWDVDLAWPALLHAKRNLGCETWMIGYNPVTDIAQAYTNEGQQEAVVVQSERSKHKIAQWAKVDANYIPWRLPKEFHRNALPVDIGLCPLLTNENTLGKSDVKAIEYTISGAAVVAQNNSVYNRDWVHGETALLVGGPQEMLDAVDLLARDENLRERLVRNAQQYVREERGLKQLRQEWGEAIGGVEADLLGTAA